jgi:hypothetical protein
MRVRLTLDEDAHDFAAYYARVRGLSLGVAISELIRKAQTAPPPALKKLRRSRNGLPLLPKTGRVITSELVKKLDDEEYDPKRFR